MTKRLRGGTKGERRANQKARQPRSSTLPGDAVEFTRPRTQRSRKPFQPLTPKQEEYVREINAKDLIFCKGPAGTGKTFVAAAVAAQMIEAKVIEKIIITRPAVPAEEEYGFFPGELEEKIAPWAAPVINILEQRLGAGAVEYMLKAKKIEIAPLGMLRGHTFENAFIIFDEAQNATPNQMKLFLSRIGENVKVIVDGDPEDQNDLRDRRGNPLPSGFTDGWDRMWGHDQVGFVSFSINDIVRSGLCRDIILRYRKESAVGQAELGNFLANATC
jgi:phosphate starvation-inducible protein PhoH and related proteins